MNKVIYLDNGATTKTDDRVVEAMEPYFKEYYGNPSSVYSFSEASREAMEKARSIIAEAIGAEKDEIIFTSGGSESDNLALRGLGAMQDKSRKNHIITTRIEHHAILHTCADLEKEGFEVTYLDVDREGFVDIDALKSAITDRTFLVSVIHGNNEIGTLQDLGAIGEVCAEKGVRFHTDAVQSFTKSDIDVKSMNIDMMSIASHKIHGPKGVGALYIKKGLRLKSQVTGGGQERKMRAGTENVPGFVGFGKAVEVADYSGVAELRDYLMERILSEIPDTFLNGPRGDKRLCNNVNIGFRFVEGEGILMHLDGDGICVSTGSACSSQSLEPSHVLMALGLKHEDAHGCIRFTLSRFTTRVELDFTVEKLKGIIGNLRAMSPLAGKESQNKGQ
jgi:cysteine desulfurase